MLSYSSQFPMQSLNSNMGWDQIADLPKNMFWLRPDCRPVHKYVSFIFSAHASMCIVSQLTLVGAFCSKIFYQRQEVNWTDDPINMKINFTEFGKQNTVERIINIKTCWASEQNSFYPNVQFTESTPTREKIFLRTYRNNIIYIFLRFRWKCMQI